MSAPVTAAEVSVAHTAFAAMAAAGGVALLVGARFEWKHFARAGLGRSWWAMRVLMPLMFALGGAAAFALAERALGSDGRILAYLGVFVVALPLWFVAHWLAGRWLRPALNAGQALWLAASPLGAAMLLSAVGHQLQPMAWALAAALARAG